MTDKSNIAIICILGMGIGFLCSTALLSIFTFLFGVNAIRDVHPREWFRSKWWIVSMCWVILYALTYFWTADKAQWGQRVQLKLPFMILPLVVTFLPQFTTKQLERVTLVLSGVFIVSALYTIFFLLIDPTHYIRGYSFAHLLPTLPKDHIRSSLAIMLFIIWCLYVWPTLQGKAVQWFVGATIFLMALYIHVLAAKSGILAFYLFLGCWGLYVAFGKRKLAGLIMIIAIPVIFIVAVKAVPTFYQRIRYTSFSYDQVRAGDKSGNYGDGNRIQSYHVALMEIGRNPWLGYGIGDVYDQMAEGYHELYPEVPKENVLFPHNEFLIVAMGCGIPVMLVFALWVFMPLTYLKRNRQSFFFFMVWLILFFQLMIEPVFEVQDGVFVYLFFAVMQLHELPDRVKV